MIVPLPDICVSALRQRKIEEDAAQATAGAAWQRGGWIVTTRWGTPIEPRNFNRSWDARCHKPGVRKITVHDGRRRCATLLVDLDVDPREVMQILRHAQISVTMEVHAQASSRATLLHSSGWKTASMDERLLYDDQKPGTMIGTRPLTSVGTTGFEPATP